MPTRIENIILRVRDTLSDPNAERYSNERLLRLLSEAQKDIAKQTKLIRNSAEILVLPDTAVFDLPEDTWLLTRASVKGAKIALHTYDEMDAVYIDSYCNNYNYSSSNSIRNTWEQDVGNTPLCLVYDKLNMQKVRVYPILNEDSLANTYTFTGGNTEFYGGFEFGVVTDMTNYTFNSPFGVITNIEDPFVTVIVSDVFGVATKISDSDNVILVNYFALTPDITSVNDTLLVSTLLDTALKHYVVSQAYLDDVDTQSQQLGATAFKLYERELVVGKATGASNNTNNVDRATPYRGPWNA